MNEFWNNLKDAKLLIFLNDQKYCVVWNKALRLVFQGIWWIIYMRHIIWRISYESKDIAYVKSNQDVVKQWLWSDKFKTERIFKVLISINKWYYNVKWFSCMSLIQKWLFRKNIKYSNLIFFIIKKFNLNFDSVMSRLYNRSKWQWESSPTGSNRRLISPEVKKIGIRIHK